MFGRRRIGTPRAVGPSCGKRKEFHQHNDGHTVRSFVQHPPSVRDALRSAKGTPTAMVNPAEKGTCAFVIDSQVIIWELHEDSSTGANDVFELVLSGDDCFAAFTSDGAGVFSVSQQGEIRFWPSYKKSTTRSLALPLPAGSTVTALECSGCFAWVGTSQGQFYHLRTKKETTGNPTLDLLRQAGKTASVLGRMFSWGSWSSSSNTSGQSLIDLCAFPVKFKDQAIEGFYLLALTESGIEVFKSTATESQVSSSSSLSP